MIIRMAKAMRKRILSLTIVFILFSLALTACSGIETASHGKLKVVATTSILADVVKQVAGEYAAVSSIVPVGSNEHEYQPAPRDIAAVSDADLVFEVGLGLEEFMSTIIENASEGTKIVTVSDGISPREFHAVSGDTHADEHATGDPHVWLDPTNVVIWVQNIQTALSEADPAHASQYQTNAEAYIAALTQLDTWITNQVSAIPVSERKIVTDHLLFGYFAEKYGFEVIGAVIPSYSSSAQPSAQEMAVLEDAIRSYGVKVILVGNNVNPALASRIAQDTGIKLISFYTGSLSESDGPAGTYIDYMKYNVMTIMNALKE